MYKMISRILILLTCCLLIASCGKKEAEKSTDADKPETAAKNVTDPVQHKVMSFNLEGLTDKGTKNWDVKGDSAESISESQLKLHNVEAKSYGNESEAVITASSGIYDKGKNNVCLDKDVKATIISTQSGTKEMFDLPDAASGQSKQKRTAGDATKKMKTVITCDGDVLFDYQNNHVYFNKNVKVVSDDGSIDADKITVNMDTVTKKITEIIAEGNVKMVRGENVTYSDKATYVESEKKVALTGQPKLVIYQEGGLAGNFLGASDASTRDTRSH